MIARRIDSI
jgi:hypothetical protein